MGDSHLPMGKIASVTAPNIAWGAASQRIV